MTASSPAPTIGARAVRLAAAAILPLLLAGCAVGPDFTPPAPPAVDHYTPHAPAETAAAPAIADGAAQHFERGRDIPGDWWTLFHSTALDALIDQALRSNHDLKAAQAALRVAHETVLAQRGAFFPAVSASFSASRQRQSTALAPVPNYPAVPDEFQYDLYTPQLSISYAPDVFGATRRTVESLRAQEQAARFQMIAAWTTLASNVAVAAIQQASLQAQIDATHRLIDADARMLRILRYRFAKGYASRLDVAAQEAQLAQANATLPPLVRQLAQQRDLLAVLAGRFPDQAPRDRIALDSLRLPRDLPLSLPSKLVEQRPDVRQAQANLHAASAQIGIATAARLPSIVLTADAGSTALTLSRLFTSGTGIWGIAGSLTAPVLEGGTLLHQQRAAKAAYVESAEQYRATVLTAFQNVADTLAALEQDAAGLRAAAQAEQAAGVTLRLSQRQARDGYAGSFELSSAEQSYQQARITLIQAEANRLADTAALYQALGGGWWHQANLEGP